MIKSDAFWDASAIVPLCIQEANTPAVRVHLRRFGPVVWWGTVVEVYSALVRMERSGIIDRLRADGVRVRLNELQQSWKEILPDSPLRELACNVLQSYPLRAADSMQLAAALVWCRQHPAGRHFICRDKRLSDAAKAAGFSVIEP